MLDGKKTYLAAGASILTIWTTVLQGGLGWKEGLIATLFAASQMFLRSAIKDGQTPVK